MESILDFSAVYLVSLVALAFFSSVFGGISGFGAGMVLAPFLLPLVGVKGVVPALATALLLGGISRAWVFRADMVPRMIPRILLSLGPGVMVGVLIYEFLPSGPLAIFIGTLLLASLVLRRYLKRRAIRPSPTGVVATSFATGIVSGGSPGGGVVIVSLLLGLGLEGAALVGTDAVIGVAVNVMRAAMFGSVGLISSQLLVFGVILGLAMIPGSYCARYIVRRMAATWHVLLIEAFILIGGATFLYHGVFG